MVNAYDVKIIAIKIVWKSWRSFKIYQQISTHPTYSKNIKCQNCAGMVLNGFIFKRIDQNVKEKKNSCEPFRICLQNSTAN